MDNFVLTWLGHGVPRCLSKHYFWVYLWECFRMRLVFELIEWVKQTALFSVSGHHPSEQKRGIYSSSIGCFSLKNNIPRKGMFPGTVALGSWGQPQNGCHLEALWCLYNPKLGSPSFLEGLLSVYPSTSTTHTSELFILSFLSMHSFI